MDVPAVIRPMGDVFSVVRPMGFVAIAFLLSVIVMPALIRTLRQLGMGKQIRDAAAAPIMAEMHKAKAGTPTMGGIIIWGTALVLILLVAAGCAVSLPGSILCRVNFLSRAQTWLPLGLMVGAALIGLVDDYLNVKKIGSKGGGLRVRHRFISYGVIAAVGAWWFYSKLGWQHVHVPFFGSYEIGLWSIPFFVLVIASTSHSVNVTDGLDGLAGGTLLSALGAYGVIAWGQGRTDLATFCAVLVGALMGFLWFNVNPAQVFMGDTGAMSLGTVLGVLALLTDQPLLLLIIGLPFVIETLSVLIQVASKKLRGGKMVFYSAPLHHHLQAIGWSEPKIVMRTWMISLTLSALGVAIALVDRF
jgi:phospho-N-acetylmuramoyl-pentapeptide-transferase